MTIQVFPPDQSIDRTQTGANPSWRLQEPKQTLGHLMGEWNVVWSTLPLWKDKKDVTITYNFLPSGDATAGLQLDDLVEYRKQSADKTSAKSTVKGIDTVDASAPNPLTFDWRGKGWLRIASSRWQIIGLDEHDVNNPQWAVTYFEKTLFTPAGLDIYLRQPLNPRVGNEILKSTDDGRAAGSLRTVEEIIEKLQALPGKVGEMAKDGFLVGRKGV